MSSIGLPGSEYSVFVMDGDLDTMGVNSEELQRPGIDGVGFRDIGRRANDTPIRTVYPFSTADNAETAIQNYKLLEGAAVTYNDPFGIEHLNVFVRKIRIIKTVYTPCYVAYGVTGAAFLVYAEWQLQLYTV